MRIEYNFSIDKVDIPYFSVESMEGPEKLFRLATLVMNVLELKDRVDVIFHGHNSSDLPRKIQAFEKILTSAPTQPRLDFTEGDDGSLGSSYYRWVTIRTSG